MFALRLLVALLRTEYLAEYSTLSMSETRITIRITIQVAVFLTGLIRYDKPYRFLA
jgi:hypothetical protein